MCLWYKLVTVHFLKYVFPARLKYILHGCDQERYMCLPYQVADEMPRSRNEHEMMLTLEPDRIAEKNISSFLVMFL